MLKILEILTVICLIEATESVINLKSQDFMLSNAFKEDDCETQIAYLQDNVLEAKAEDLLDSCRDLVRVESVKYICRGVGYVYLEWSLEYVYINNLNNLTYLIEKWSTNDTENNEIWTFHSRKEGNKAEIDGLRSNTEYKFRVTPYLKKFKIGQSSASDYITTLTGGETPKEVKHINATYFNINSSVTVQIRWEPLEDLFCEVAIIYQSHIDDTHPKYVKVKGDNFYDIPNLLYRTTYEIILFSTVNHTEGPQSRFTFKTSPCTEFRSDFDCFPKIPTNLRVEGNCSPEIKWDDPIMLVGYFTHYELSVKTRNLNLDFNVPENETGIKLDTVENGPVLVNITVYSEDGIIGLNSISDNITCNFDGTQNTEMNKNYSKVKVNVLTRGKIIMLLITIVSVPAIIIFTTVWRLFFWRKLQKNVDRMQPDESFRKDKKSHKIETSMTDKDDLMKDSTKGLDEKILDEYEVSRDRVRLCQVLGEGEFGKVHKAVLMETDSYLRYVAVKTLRNKESAEEKRQLEKEMEVMKSVGKHRNIVSLLGCCTNDLMIIVEYCSLGDLRSFLRKTWRIKSYAEEAINEKSNIDLLDRNAFSNILYEQSATDIRHLNLSMMDLLSFARQIALGMAYLAENRVVHRDVAARNVLLAEDMTAKIADFGLSRDVYERNIYMKSSTDRLPLRWMALESLQYQVFSTKSDVWSYGILLWEIMTLGGCPYPSLQTSEMYKLLQKGYRMEKPKPCSPQLYEIMLNCWDAKSQNRPSFSQLVLSVEAIMKSESNRSYLDLSTCDYKSQLD